MTISRASCAPPRSTTSVWSWRSVIFIRTWSEHFNVPAEFHTSGLDNERLAPEIETALYRIAQEALNNVYKHAGASRADVILEQREGDAVLIIEDDGRGFDPEVEAAEPGADGRGMGLVGMRERAALAGGAARHRIHAGSRHDRLRARPCRARKC